MADAAYYTILTAARTAIRGLTLTLPDATTLPSARVYLRKVLTDRNTTLPCVIVFMPPAPETVAPFGNNLDEIGYAVGVCIIAASNQDYELAAGDEKFLKWRQQVRRLFHDQRLAGTGGYRCTWEPAPVLSMGDWLERNLWVQGGIVRARQHENRDTST